MFEPIRTAAGQDKDSLRDKDNESSLQKKAYHQSIIYREEATRCNEVFTELENKYIQNIFNFLKNLTDAQLLEVATYINNNIDEFDLPVIKDNVNDCRTEYDEAKILADFRKAKANA